MSSDIDFSINKPKRPGCWGVLTDSRICLDKAQWMGAAFLRIMFCLMEQLV